MESLVAVHELVEVLLCDANGFFQNTVDDFDMEYEKNRKPGDESEPGDDPKAPYHRQHCIATGVERILAAELGVNWKEYEDCINALFHSPKTGQGDPPAQDDAQALGVKS